MVIMFIMFKGTDGVISCDYPMLKGPCPINNGTLQIFF